ncbi:MAG: protein translocase subunit SecD [Anaerolineae bacterium]|nr:protein translocase subunit SecD [Anaerolineae bacterium]
MRNSTGLWLVVIAAITILALYMIWPNNPGLFGRPIEVRPGLDIQGGLRVLLAADTSGPVDAGALDQAKQIVDRRVNALGVAEPVVQVSGGNRIVVELPGIRDPQAAIDTVKQTGLLEFVDFTPTGANCTASSMPEAGAYILTDRQVALRGNAPAATATNPAAVASPAATGAAATPGASLSATLAATQAATPAATEGKQGVFRPFLQGTPAATQTPEATAAATAAATTAATPAATTAAAGTPGSKDNPLVNPCTGQPFTTVMTGAGLQNAEARVGGQNASQYVVGFTLVGNDESQRFANHTKTHIGQPLAIVLDGQVLSAPIIQSELPTGGEITGNFTRERAQELALQLRYGALPVALRVESIEEVGASLGQASIQASVQAGLIGVLVVLAFMLIYYRVPGAVADVALLLFAAINFALYKFIPVTLTLPSIVGFLISVGAAVDGNILIFERVKEELRAGRSLDKAIELGFSRAWPSIRDSNISTIVIGLIVYFFGGQFGAGAVRGFAVTLILGLLTNMFTAVIVTHTFLNVVLALGGDSIRRMNLFGISDAKKTGE